MRHRQIISRKITRHANILSAQQTAVLLAAYKLRAQVCNVPVDFRLDIGCQLVLKILSTEPSAE
jgi:hypothetical protein